MTTNIFEQASRKNLRFDSPKGKLTVEDLWDIPLTSIAGQANLDDIAKALHRKLKDSDEISFVKPVVSASNDIQLKFDIAKYIIDIRIVERDSKAEAASRSEKKQKILEIIARKQDGALEATSLEDLQKMAESL